MKLLAIDTATEALSVSLAVEGGQIDRYFELDRGHSERVLPLVQEVLDEAGIALGALDAIAFGRGPGGFTGVRLAASVVQGLAFGVGIGVVPVSNLAAVARRIADEDPSLQQVLVANDARMREVYWAWFDVQPLFICLRGEERVSPPDEVAVDARPPGASWAAAGRGLRAWPDLASRCAVAGARVHPDVLPRAREILALARIQVEAGQVLDATEALPVYVRDRVAVPAL